MRLSLFKSRYVFETQGTRKKRRLQIFLTALGLLMGAYGLIGPYLVHWARVASEKSQQTFYQRSPDLIVVFTGHAGRIPFAVNLGLKYNRPHIFITGVYPKNTVDSLLNDYKVQGIINPDFLEIDYLAKNTMENVLSTLRYLRTKQGIETVLITSHDYHLRRIQLIIQGLKRQSDPYEFFYMGPQADYTRPRNLKILYREATKFLRSWALVSLWNQG